MGYRVILFSSLFLMGVLAYAEEQQPAFRPVVFWGNTEVGTVLTSVNEILVVDSKGERLGKISATGAISNIVMSPDGKKLAYITAIGIWLAKVGESSGVLLVKGYSDYFRWNGDGASMLFSLGEHKYDGVSPASNMKLFWADGEGKNVRQVYP